MQMHRIGCEEAMVKIAETQYLRKDERGLSGQCGAITNLGPRMQAIARNVREQHYHDSGTPALTRWNGNGNLTVIWGQLDFPDAWACI